MSRYEVTRLIRSAIRLGEDVEINGIRFHPVVPFQGDQVVVSKTIEGQGFREASKLFDEHLLPVVDAVTVMSGSPLDPVGASTLITKSRSKYVYLRATKRRSSGQMTIVPAYHHDLLDRSTRAAALLVQNPQLRGAAYYLRRAALAESLLAATFHTLQAADALASVGRRVVDQRRLRGLMGDELYVYFRTEDPVSRDTRRHALAHGRLIDEEGLPARTDELQMRVVKELRQELGGTGVLAYSPVRGFAIFETFTRFLEPIERLPELPDLVDAATEGVIHSQTDPRLVGTEVSRRLWRRW
jgi:hypothetical protein